MLSPVPTDVDAAASLARATLTARYGVPVMVVRAHAVAVLPGKPLTAVRTALQEAGLGVGLAEAIELDDLPQWEVPAAGISLWRQHAADTPELVTQLVQGDPPLRVVAEHDARTLVAAADGATGWIDTELLAPHRLTPAAPFSNPTEPRGSATALAREVESLLGTPYRWGGTTVEGIDCSGLVQRAMWNTAGVWLPRHSTHLLRCGTRVARSDLRTGDVLVLRRRKDAPDLDGNTGHMHVAVCVDAGDAIHASRDALAVTREPLGALLERYDLLGGRRLC